MSARKGNVGEAMANQGTHTLGPWNVDHDFDGDYAIFSFGGVHICTTVGDTPEDEANAKIMAAAPELVKALEAAHKLLTAEMFDTSDELVNRCKEVAEQIRAALKAAGR